MASIGKVTSQLYFFEFSNISLIKGPQSYSHIDLPIFEPVCFSIALPIPPTIIILLNFFIKLFIILIFVEIFDPPIIRVTGFSISEVIFFNALISSAICKALEVAGAMTAALFDKSTSFADALKGAICGEDADDDTINGAIEDMFNTLGSGGAAFGNRERVVGFAEDLASSVSQRELIEGFVGQPSAALLNIADTIIEWEYPEMREGLGGTDDIERFFINVGNLLPADFKAEMRDYLSSVPEDDLTPANPTLCATPQQLEDFKELRCQLLEGRATKEDCDAMYESVRGQFLDDLDSLNKVVHNGIPDYIMSNFPPIVSTTPDPDCQDGLIPYEPEEVTNASTKALGTAMEQLKIEYSKDMLGNGPGERNWGLMNMILCDTLGKPYTTHKRKANGSNTYVDFYVNLETDLADMFKPDKSNFDNFAPVFEQKGAYPSKVAGWLQEKMQTIEVEFEGNNTVQGPEKSFITFEDLGFTGAFWTPDNINLTEVPDFGYNVSHHADLEDERVYYTRETRKKDPDVKLKFRDNAAGVLASGTGEANYSYGFNAELYLSDIVNKSPIPEAAAGGFFTGTERNVGIASPGDSRLVWADNARVAIREFFNGGVNLDYSITATMTRKEKKEFEKEAEDQVIEDLELEFLAVDDAFEDFEDIADEFPNFYSSFISYDSEAPEVKLLKDMAGQYTDFEAGESMSALRDAFMSNAFAHLLEKVAQNDGAFN